MQDQRGKFRSFLLTFLKHFLSDERDRAGAQKRGGGKTLVSLDDTAAEERYLDQPANSLSPVQIFERRWAETVMERALARLRQEYESGGKAALFEQLKDVQPGGHGTASYAEIGVRLGLAETAVNLDKQRQGRPRFELGKALAECRQEHSASAAGWAQKTLGGTGQLEHDATAYVVLAMA